MEPIRLGIVGLGRAGNGMHNNELKDRQDKFKVVAVADVIPERCEEQKKLHDCATYGSIDELLADEQVEVVDIATRSRDHFEHAMKALDSGKDVFLEKPICLTYEQAVKLKAAAEKAKGTLYIRHNRRFERAFQHIREIIASGVLGTVREIKLRRTQYQRRKDWQTIKEFGGGQLLNWGPHIIDHALRFIDGPVAEQFSDLQHIAAAGDAEDHLKIVLKGENGLLVDLEITGGAALSEPVYLVWGDRGALRCENETELELRYLDPEQKLQDIQADPNTPGTGSSFGNPEELRWIEKTIPVEPELDVQMSKIWDYLYDTIRNGKPFPISLEESVAVMEVIDKAKAGTEFEVT